MIPAAVQQWCEQNGMGRVIASQPVAGGCINNGMRLTTANGSTLFLKTNSQVPADTFEKEAAGLRALNIPGGARIPQVYLSGAHYLLLEDLQPAPRRRDYWQQLGQQLAALHNLTNPQFGFPHNNYIGATLQINSWTTDGYTFFAEHRLGYQTALARQKNRITPEDARQIERIAARLPALIPEQPASLLHGDLWSGNLLTDALGNPALIDPAAHYGWAEADLAMTALFGGFEDEFYEAYQRARPLVPGLWERIPIYNLYHLLNHVNLFGGGYLAQVKTILRRFA
ncbi:MAG: fructosamine kinase family protein [Anaerolineales bacterium]